jgi:sugar phosphate isomerase/epimerase
MILSVTTMPWGKKKTSEDFESVLETIKDIGFEGVGIEHSLIPKELMHQPEKLASIVKRVGLENGGTYSRTRASDIPWAKRSKTPLFWVSVKEENYAAALRTLRDFTTRATKYGIISSLHNELRSSFETQEQLVGALNAIKGLTLCIDTAHGVGAGVDCLELIEKYPKRISLVHLKDLREILPKSKIRFKRDFVNVGDGSLDLKSVVKKLESVGYKGQLMLEIEALAGQKPADVVKKGYEYINSKIL